MKEQGLEEVVDLRLRPGMGLSELIQAYSGIHGFMAGHLAEAVRLLSSEIPESSIRILTFTGNLVSTGLRGVFEQAIREGLFNVVFTTTGTLDHDIARAVGGRYYKGLFELDDRELYDRGFHRLGNILIPLDDYGPRVEGFVSKLVERIASEGKTRLGIHEILDIAGSMLPEGSILRAAHDTGTPVFVPGWPDGAFGTALFMEAVRQGVDVIVDYFRDMRKLSDMFFPKEGKATGLIIGGGISKHHAIWWSQFRDGLDSVVYVTTAVEYDGSLSGAHPREAVSWGKVKKQARKIVVYGDATVLVPIIIYGVMESTIWTVEKSS